MNRHITMILVEPEHPDNIGSAARAMKNMGLRELRLVHPPPGWKRKGRKMAMSARDVLEGAKVFKSLDKAVEDCHFVVGTTRRHGARRRKTFLFGEAVSLLKSEGSRHKVGIVFGKESKGLANRHLALCDGIVTIPSDEGYPSLNLAQAVMVMAFSLYDPERKEAGPDAEKPEPLRRVSKSEMEEILEHFRHALITLGYRTERHSIVNRILASLRRLFNRSGLEAGEYRMFKGLTRRIRERPPTGRR